MFRYRQALLIRHDEVSRCIFDERVLEVGPDAVLVGSDKSHAFVGSSTKLGFRAGRHLRSDRMFEVGVEPLIRIEFGAV